MIFEPNELQVNKILVSPRICHGGELVAMWITSYGKAAATHLWDIAVARAFSNTEEIEIAIAAEKQRLGCDRSTAQKNLILRSGLYKLSQEAALEDTVTISLKSEVVQSLKAAADKEGITVDEYIRSKLV